jgi:hypothetical protein
MERFKPIFLETWTFTGLTACIYIQGRPTKRINPHAFYVLHRIRIMRYYCCNRKLKEYSIYLLLSTERVILLLISSNTWTITNGPSVTKIERFESISLKQKRTRINRWIRIQTNLLGDLDFYWTHYLYIRGQSHISTYEKE